MNLELLKRDVAAAVDGMRAELLELSHAIHQEPELALEEFKAAKRLSDAVASHDLPVQRGAFDYLTKPFVRDELRAKIGRALETRRWARDRERLLAVGQTLASSGIMERVLDAVAQATVLEPARGRAATDYENHAERERRAQLDGHLQELADRDQSDREHGAR